MPFCSRNTCGFLEKSTLFMSIFHTPSKALCAAASLGIDRAANATRKNSFFIANLHWFELRSKLYQNWCEESELCVAWLRRFAISFENPMPEEHRDPDT